MTRSFRPKTMIKPKTMIAIAASAFVLAACATQPTPYQAAKRVGAEGYDSAKIETGKYRVTFKGNTATDLATIENYILLRAAELTVGDGLGHFFVLDGNDTSNSTFRSTGFNSGFGGGFGRAGFRRGFGGFGGFGTTTSRTRQTQSFAIDVVIQAYPGQKPEDAPEAYNAQDVIANLGAVVARPDLS